ncbi:MAG: division/cell wall cluster transcriptional repressor MraZ [Desulfatibacillaceae bacterium]
MSDYFRGTCYHTADEKARLAIPAKFRDVVKKSGDDSGVVVSKWADHLVAYTMGRWSDLERNIVENATKTDKMQRFIRFFIGGAHECQFDKQGRILLPGDLREYAGIEPRTEVSLVGALDHLEIWSRERLVLEDERLEKDLEDPEFRELVNSLM